MPVPTSRLTSHAPAASWARIAAPKPVNAGTPASTWLVWPSVPARKDGASDVKSPKAAKETNALPAAAKNDARAAAGTAMRCGR